MNLAFANPAYFWYETAHRMLTPARATTRGMKVIFGNPSNPISRTVYGRTIAAACELFENATQRYGKPTFGFSTTLVDGQQCCVSERVVWERPFGRLIAFDRDLGQPRPKPNAPIGQVIPFDQARHRAKPQPKLMMIAPLSGHFATLLRGTVEAFLPTHQVFITDWTDARMVPLSQGRFDLDDYIDYLIAMFRALGPDLHILAVCQSSVPVIAAIASMEAENDPLTPRSVTLIAGPIDARRSPTAVNRFAEKRSIEWFRKHCIAKVPSDYPGSLRDVYPGFMQLSSFMAMNIDRHLTAHCKMLKHLVNGDGEAAEKHRDFYDEYLAVMDMTAEFYLQTVEQVFLRHDLPKGAMIHRGKRVDLGAIRRCAIMVVEGEKDDITGVGQTRAALELTPNLPRDKKVYHLQKGAGHYGVFNGSRFRAEIAPRITHFILEQQMHAGSERDIDPGGMSERRLDTPVAAATASHGEGRDPAAGFLDPS
ncbi:polyhydroxyalkanoate depolymerase [Sinorhizobium alkalisoli]|uniref:Esterase n=1 Tax=Sinorhizobium alkalisoli TaxID=1752398 RepID=A0A1E3VET7_9HYPH|nr:polyhydroxyalkanoate depolymerase [Sinorhizobium alkalisoli]ODR92098.1 esterase [Sinorhizobium alkalisoli]